MGSLTQGFLLDSDILIYHANGRLDPRTERFLFGLLRQPVYMSVISRMEVLGWRGHTDQSWQMMNDLLETLEEIGLDEEVVRKTIHIRRTVRIKLPDAIIASSALARRLTLVTRNLGDFCLVPGLTVVDPFNVEGEST